MAYQANRRGGSNNPDKQRNIDNNANNVRNAADVAMASGNPYAMAAGGAVKAADKVTGGKSSELIGKRLAESPGGKKIQNLSNKINESGLGDKAGQIAVLKNRTGRNTNPNNRPNQVKNNKTGGGEPESSLPSSRREKNQKNQNNQKKQETSEGREKRSAPRSMPPRRNNNENKDSDSSSEGEVVTNKRVKIMIMILAPFMFLILIAVIIISSVITIFSDFDDALGISSFTGRDTGNIAYGSTSEEQRAFYERVNNVELEMLSQGKKVDALKIVAVYHVLKQNGADIDYEDMTEAKIKEIAESMLLDGAYDENTFKNNLINSIIPKYIPKASKTEKERIASEVLNYVSRYYDLIDKEEEEDIVICEGGGSSCSYNIKGFYIKGKGNISKSMNLSNIYVRLMQCGTANGHNYGGTFGKPLAGEELVPFEKYILGVAYQEIGPGAPAEAIKAQMVAARSYILARHVDMGGWRTLKQENGKWILQAAACTQDQVYCDPDKGCSSNNGQWGQVHSGQGHGTGLSRGPLSKTSPLRSYANQTSGEVLVNKKGYVVYSGYTSTEQNKMSSLARNGLNYKQILMQVYNQGSRNYGAANITKFSCGSSGNNCTKSTGAYANWKQTNAPWSNVKMGNSGRTIGQIGCLVTSISMLIAKSGVPTVIDNFNPGTFVQFLNKNGGFDGYGNLVYAPISKAAPKFKYVNQVSLRGMSKQQKLNTIKKYASEGYYMAVEVSPNGQHWVAIDTVNGNNITMMDPATRYTDLWNNPKYTWQSTKTINLFKVS